MKTLRKGCALAAAAVVAVLAGRAVAQTVDLGALFSQLRSEARTVEGVLRGFLERDLELEPVCRYAVSHVEGVGLAVAYARACVCLAPEQPVAQEVGEAVVEAAPQAARNAVQAGVVSALASYAAGRCDEVLEERVEAAEAFAAPAGAEGGGPPAGGGAPDVILDEEPASPSQ
ncbi:MAG: hypothetical protein KatS3mg124_0717 [Porticoccaceae bacterium]|nr:MAG: hypothetical protein KatS3mg124_0717 [Porticoccaceae bacterium]